MTQPVSVIPANARATNLTMVDNVIYTVTSHSCNDAPNAVWAIDLSVDPLKVRSFELQEGNSFGSGDPVIGNDGTVYVRSGTGPGVPSNALLALTPRELQLKNHFFLRVPATRDSIDVSDLMNVASPVVFDYKGRELIVTPCLDNRLCLLDAAMPGGSDHATPLYRTPQLTPAAGSLTNLAERGVWGSLSSWQDADGTRWILAPVLGPMDSGLSVPTTNGAVTNGFIAAFKVQEESGTLRLTPVWVSRDLSFPMPPVTASGVVFALSAGEFTRQIRMTAGVAALEERPRGSTHATLYALDAATGRELYSSRNLVTVPAAFTGLTVTTGRVYFGGADGVLYAFGLPMVR